MTQWWDLWHSAFTPAECQQIRSNAMRLVPAPATVGQNYLIKPERRVAEIRWLDLEDESLKWFYGRLAHCFAMSNSRSFSFDLTGFRECQYSVYHAEESGHYDWHADTQWRSLPSSPSMRKLSLVIQLSDPSEYEGGGLEFGFDKFKDDQFRAQGDLVIFASMLKHRVLPVTKGERHSLVTWCYGPHFR